MSDKRLDRPSYMEPARRPGDASVEKILCLGEGVNEGQELLIAGGSAQPAGADDEVGDLGDAVVFP
jgi:hypothetical protein